MAGSAYNHVFISYRNESPEHERAVRRLGELLRQAGLPVDLDQFYLDEHPGGPEGGPSIVATFCRTLVEGKS